MESRSDFLSGVMIGGLAVSGVALAGLAVGAAAIGNLAVRRAALGNVVVKRLQIGELDIRRSVGVGLAPEALDLGSEPGSGPGSVAPPPGPSV
ncbi:hypothetical protein BN1051_01331 [Arthrobacter saudimassiliensis]|uniref:Uncharacterized protein n=1 Tax=Arthrobacter saudimassiliensis TaxID=1461584 RepID=A0A078MT73_9MICC|nr:hypothetical protein BN1051_01331 [Arthrobacter saudimassiliensis]